MYMLYECVYGWVGVGVGAQQMIFYMRLTYFPCLPFRRRQFQMHCRDDRKVLYFD